MARTGKPGSPAEPGDVALSRRGPVPTDALTGRASLETLEAAYELWAEQRARHAAMRVAYADERRRLDDEAAFLVGAARAAGASSAPTTKTETTALDPTSAPLGAFVAEAEARIAAAREAIERRMAEDEQAFTQAFTELRRTILDRVLRYLERARPKLRLTLRRVGAQRRILHLDRITADDGVLLAYVFTGRIPSRHGFLLDDSTDDVQQAPPPLYPDEGVPPDQVRPTVAELERRLRTNAEVLPIKGFLPVLVPRPGAEDQLFRLLSRGVVLEVEVAEGEAFRNILERDEAERFAGHLLRLKLEGRIELELAAD